MASLPAVPAVLILLAAHLAPAAAEAAPLPLGRAASSPPELALTFEEAAVLAAGLTPDGEALVMAVSREPQGYYTRVVPHQELMVADGAGEIRLELDRPVPVRSVWVVADLASGALGIATPGAFPLRHTEIGPADLRRGASGKKDRLHRPLERLELLVFRPGVGAWRGSLHDGADADADGADDGKLLAVLPELAPLGSAPAAPDEVLPGDRLVAIDPSTLALFTFKVPR